MELTSMWWVLIAIYCAQFFGVLWAVSLEKDMPQGYVPQEEPLRPADRDKRDQDRRAA